MAESDFRYRRLAKEIAGKIRAGEFKTGEKLPSLRQMKTTTTLGMATVYQAYVELEKQGWVTAKKRSGFFVAPRPAGQQPDQPDIAPVPQTLSVNELARTLVTAMGNPGIIQFGGAAPSETLLPLKALTRTLKGLSGDEVRDHLKTYEDPKGNPRLRAEIAKRMVGGACPVSADDIVVTNGCMEAISLSIQAVASSGDTIAVERPTFHGLLQLIEDFGMKALELPTDTRSGIILDEIEPILDAGEVRAVVVNPNFQNPMGYVMPGPNKKKMVALLERKQIPLIEDDVYGELHFGTHRPSTLKRFDKSGNVIYCASFSKTLAPGLRVGWVAGGRFMSRIARLKMETHVAGPGLSQAVVARYLSEGGFNRHLRRMRGLLENQMMRMIHAVSTYFPDDIKISDPKGGMILWVQLPRSVDAMRLFHAAADKQIIILPGHLCSGSSQYTSCIRMNCGDIWSKEKDRAVKVLGDLIRSQTVY